MLLSPMPESLKMSIIIFKGGVLVGDRNLMANEYGNTTAVGRMQKVHRSPCGAIAIAVVGDDRPKERTEQLIAFLVSILRRHTLEIGDSVFVGSIVVDISPLLDLDRNSIIILTKEHAYIPLDGQLVPVGPNHHVAHGTGHAAAHLAIANGLDAVGAIELALKVMCVPDRSYDIVRQSELCDLITSAEDFEIALDAVARIQNATSVETPQCS